jgi:hypothetical protein
LNPILDARGYLEGCLHSQLLSPFHSPSSIPFSPLAMADLEEIMETP